MKIKKNLKTCDNWLTNDEVDKFYRSKTIVEIQDFVEREVRGEPLSNLEKCEVHDYVLDMFTLTTSTLPGALEKMTLEHYTTARVNPKSGRQVILFSNHK